MVCHSARSNFRPFFKRLATNALCLIRIKTLFTQASSLEVGRVSFHGNGHPIGVCREGMASRNLGLGRGVLHKRFTSLGRGDCQQNRGNAQWDRMGWLGRFPEDGWDCDVVYSIPLLYKAEPSEEMEIRMVIRDGLQRNCMEYRMKENTRV
jgi:hypothetical protein